MRRWEFSHQTQAHTHGASEQQSTILLNNFIKICTNDDDEERCINEANASSRCACVFEQLIRNRSTYAVRRVLPFRFMNKYIGEWVALLGFVVGLNESRTEYDRRKIIIIILRSPFARRNDVRAQCVARMCGGRTLLNSNRIKNEFRTQPRTCWTRPFYIMSSRGKLREKPLARE